MSVTSALLPLAAAGVSVVIAAAFACAEVGLSRVSRVRVEELLADAVPAPPAWPR